MKTKFKYIFGPVPSRRLGISLGVDILMHKTCSFDCVYCECGKTTDLTIKRKNYIPAEEVISELAEYLAGSPELDYITFSGAGEPVLNSDIGIIIAFLKKEFPGYKVAVLTNSSLFFMDDAVSAIIEADLVVASLDSVTEDGICKINRPNVDLLKYNLLDGLLKVRKHFKGDFWLEIFIVPGINDSEEELSELKRCIDKLKPGKVQITSLDRPGTEDWVRPLSEDRIRMIKQKLGIKESILKAASVSSNNYELNSCESIFNTIKRRPCTISDIHASLNIDIEVIENCLNDFKNNDMIIVEKLSRGKFYRIKPQ